MDWIRVLSAYVTGFVIFVVLSGIVSSAVAYTITIIQRISEISG